MFMRASPATRQVVRFIAAGLVATAIIGAGGYWVVRSNAVAEATRNAQEVAAITGRGIVGPALTDSVIGGDPTAFAAFDRLIRDRVLSARVVRVKIWTPEGSIIYSDLASLVGQVFPLAASEQAAYRENRVVAEISELNKPENRYERGYGQLLEVYLPVVSASGHKLLFETYQVYSSISDDERRIWSAFFPLLLGAIALLFVVQVPLAWRLATSLESARREREALLERALDASAAERRRIARDLHDGVVQALAGVAFSLGGVSATAIAGGDDTLATQLKKSGEAVRQAIRDLRTLIVEIAAPDLEGKRLEDALAELLAPLEAQGLKVSLEVNSVRGIDRERTVMLYRAAQEAVRNVVNHSGATGIEVRAAVVDHTAVLSVHDNGHGFTADEVVGRRREGHVGLAMLRSLVEDGGGELRVSSTAEGGTTIEVSVPA
jgi:two-component system, NarL family, sensor kinase